MEIFPVQAKILTSATNYLLPKCDQFVVCIPGFFAEKVQKKLINCFIKYFFSTKIHKNKKHYITLIDRKN